MKIVKRLFLIGFMSVLLLCTVVLGSYYYVEFSTKDNRYKNVEDIPYNRVALVLGTSPVSRWGSYNHYFYNRIDACVELYNAGKISKILVSGDNHVKEYDEPQYMKEALMKRGVPEEDIFMDYAGFRTLDSVVRSKKVFCQDSITIVSQGFHNARALCLADWNDIDAVAYDAQDGYNHLLFGVIRESLARVKMVIDLIFFKQPKFLCEKIEI